MSCRVKADRRAELLAEATVENGKVQASRQAVEDGRHVRERPVYFGHVAAHHRVRQSARRGKGLNVLLRRLGVARRGGCTEGQGAVQKLLARLRANLDQLRDGKSLQ